MPGLRRELIDCWITVSNAGGAAGFPFPPVDEGIVAPVADQLIASLSPGTAGSCSRWPGNALAGSVHLRRQPDPLIAHGGTTAICRLFPPCAVKVSAAL